MNNEIIAVEILKRLCKVGDILIEAGENPESIIKLLNELEDYLVSTYLGILDKLNEKTNE